MDIGEFGAAKREAELHADPNREPDTFTYFGERIRIADSIGVMPIMEFASAAVNGVDTADMVGLASIMSMLQDCIDERDWREFVSLSKRHKADADLLLKVVQSVMEVIAGRPTEQPSGSSSGGLSSSPPLNVSSQNPVRLQPVSEIAVAG